MDDKSLLIVLMPFGVCTIIEFTSNHPPESIARGTQLSNMTHLFIFSDLYHSPITRVQQMCRASLSFGAPMSSIFICPQFRFLIVNVMDRKWCRHKLWSSKLNANILALSSSYCISLIKESYLHLTTLTRCVVNAYFMFNSIKIAFMLILTELIRPC